MLRNKEKAQGMVEFALILPLLLLLLLGIIEAARIIWAYTTVQTAAREAARYAISGRPYAGSPSANSCLEPAGDPSADSPWVCDPISRTWAIESVAISRTVSSINVSTTCRSGYYNSCRDVPNAFAVQVVGQATDPLSPTVVYTQVGHAGTQGLNVKISTYYNLQMIDPVFDAIMGYQTIEIRGELSMQNEGIDKALSSAPPPSIGNTNNITTTGGTGTGPNGERIWALNSPVEQGSNLLVHLESHFNLAGPYDVYLSDSGGTKHLICTNENTEPLSNNKDVSCPISGAIPPGFYTLYSTTHNSDTVVATSDQQVEVKSSSDAKIQVKNDVGGNVAPVNSFVTIELLAHQVPDENFDLYLVYGSGPTEQLIIPNVPAIPNSHTWRVPDLGTPNPCPAGGTIPCFIQSRRVVSPTVVYASGDFFISQPEIVLSGGNLTYTQGETMHAFLRGHTPGIQYDLKISDSGGTNTCFLGRTPLVDVNGTTTNPVNWTVPATSVPNCAPSTGWPDGTYEITSHPAVGSVPRNPASMTSANQVARLENVVVGTPAGPFLTIDGGYTWPVGSVINIQAHKHPPANNPYYFKFGSWRVSIAGSTPADTFSTGAAETYVTSYRIPLTATVGVTATIPVSSFINTGNVYVASRNVTVFPVPVIMVLEGSTVTPDTIINVKIMNHSPNSSYRIIYLDKLLGTVLTDANGQGQLTYNLKEQLPVDSPPGHPNVYGTPYPLFSQDLLASATVATTQLTLRPADLRVVSIQLPSNPVLNTSMPFTFTIQNTAGVTVTRYFDTDLYLDPSPVVPAYQPGTFNFPGNYKLWRNSLGPGASFTLVQPFFIGSYGPHQLYSYADTSNLIINENSELNNILSNTLTLNCTPTFITDSFNNNTSLTNWTTQLYGNAENGGTSPTVSSGRLQLRSDGSSSTFSDDNVLVPARGYTFYRRTTPVATSSGLDVRVQVHTPPNVTNGSQAGLEVRDTLLATSPKLEFGLVRVGSGSFRIRVVFRDGVSPTPILAYQSTNTVAAPHWLRIQRYGGTDTFLFYTSTNGTSWGTPIYTAKIDLSNQLEYGLFMNTAGNGNHQTAQFDDFSYGNPNSCPAAQGQPPISNAPPGLTSCTDPLAEKSFENPPLTRWVLNGSQGVLPAPGSAHTGNWKLLAPTFDSTFRLPSFYQQFAMSSFVISSTTNFKLSFFKNIDSLADGDDAGDRFYALVTTGPTISSTWVTDPVQVADGIMGTSSYSPIDWRAVNLTLSPASGINLEDYAGQNLYLHFYNNSNTTCDPPINCHATKFHFDDVSLSPCTTQPLPQSVITRIKGEVILHQLGSSDQRIPGVRVWIYSEGGQLFETTTIQNGEFNFYNLPATSTGVKYFIYSEYNIVNPANPSEIDTLTGNTTVVLTSANNDTNPVTARLDLY